MTTVQRREVPAAPPQTEAQIVAGKNEKFDEASRNIDGADRRHLVSDQPSEHRGAAAGHQRAGGQGAAAISRRHAGSAASGELHVRNEHANLQYRINGIMLPDGVGAFGQILDTGSSAALRYHRRAAGAIRPAHGGRARHPDQGEPSTTAAGRRLWRQPGTFTPSFEYGGKVGQTQYFFSGRFLQNNLGIENPTPSINAIHDRTRRKRDFVSLDHARSHQPPDIHQRRVEQHIPDSQQSRADAELHRLSGSPTSIRRNSTSTRTSSTSSTSCLPEIGRRRRLSRSPISTATASSILSRPDRRSRVQRRVVGRLPSELRQRHPGRHRLARRLCPYAALWIFRQRGALSGQQHIHRAASRSASGNQATPPPAPFDPPFSVFDSSAKTGWLIGTYLQDEWKITNQLTLNAGLRFDQMYQYVDANQLSPRVSLTWKPYDGTTFHAGYARNFTPPQQVIAAPTNLALVTPPTAPANTQTPEVPLNSPVLPERANVFDIGVVQKIYPVPGLEVGVDAYYKIARDLLDDGQFGAAYVLNGFNYDAARISASNSRRSTRTAISAPMGTSPGPNRSPPTSYRTSFCSAPDELAYIATHYIYTDHAQNLTASAGASYLWNGTRFSASMIYGSGLRSGFVNTDHVPSYTQVNVGHVARIQHRRAEQADDGALRRRQSVRHQLRDPGRFRHRRVRAAIRAAPRLLFRRFAKAVKPASAGRRSCQPNGCWRHAIAGAKPR